MDSKIKIVIGILIVGIILIGGWWILSNRSSENIPNEETYKKGESITFKIDDDVQICTNDLPFSIIKPNGESVKLKHSCMGIVGSGIDAYCENEKIIPKRVRLCDFSDRWCGGCSDALHCWNESIHETFTWDQKGYVEITEECEGKTIRREVKKQVPEGKYQIIVNGKVIKEFVIGPSECESWKQRIEEKIANSKYCNADSDCINVFVPSCTFGCNKVIVNKDKADKLKGEVEKFIEKCNDSCLLKCLKLTPRCIDNKCQP